MTKKEMVKLLKFLNSYYQQKFDYPKGNKQDTKMMIETWYMFLEEFDYQVVRTAVKKIVVNKEWPPTPGELVKEIKQMQTAEENKLTAGEAWNKVIKAIKKHSYFYNPEKVKEALPEKAKKAAYVVGFNLIARQGDGNSYVFNSFKEVYNNLADKEDKREMLPESVREDVEKVADKFKGKPALKGEIEE